MTDDNQVNEILAHLEDLAQTRTSNQLWRLETDMYSRLHFFGAKTYGLYVRGSPWQVVHKFRRYILDHAIDTTGEPLDIFEPTVNDRIEQFKESGFALSDEAKAVFKKYNWDLQAETPTGQMLAMTMEEFFSDEPDYLTFREVDEVQTIIL